MDKVHLNNNQTLVLQVQDWYSKINLLDLRQFKSKWNALYLPYTIENQLSALILSLTTIKTCAMVITAAEVEMKLKNPRDHDWLRNNHSSHLKTQIVILRLELKKIMQKIKPNNTRESGVLILW